MFLLNYIPVLELLVFNLFSIDKCLRKKYSSFKAILVLLLWTAVQFGFFYIISDRVAFEGNGSLMLLGLLYLIPFRYLYRNTTVIILVVSCTCWVYTLGVFSLSREIASLISPHVLMFLVLENLFFLITMFPFYKKFIPKFTYVLDNLKAFDQKWYKYLAAANCLLFLALAAIQSVFISERVSFGKVFALLALIASIFMSYFIFYKLIVDSMKMLRLEYVAMHDPLTGLGNRTQLWETLNSLISTKQTFSVLFMDLDRFKQINDKYGHMIGDEYLKHFSRISADILGEKGKVHRFGGDEFVAIYYGEVPKSLLKELKECRGWEKGAPCPFNQVSTGSLLCQPPHQSVEEILHQVDDLMYQNKVKKRATAD